MITGENWSVDPQRLADALEIWRREEPDRPTRDAVNEVLMDLVVDPLHGGREDPEHPGIRYRRVPKTNVVITYVPDGDTRIVYVSTIG